MQTSAQIAKCRGLLPDVKAADIKAAGIDLSELPTDVHAPECGHPDEVDPEIANHADPQELADELGLDLGTCKGLIEAHRRMANAVGKGAYPPNCNPA